MKWFFQVCKPTWIPVKTADLGSAKTEKMQPITLYNAELAQDKLSSLAMVQLSSTVFNILNNYDWNEMNCFILLLFKSSFICLPKGTKFFLAI